MYSRYKKADSSLCLTLERSERFNCGDDYDINQSKNVNETFFPPGERSFYDGKMLENRMTSIRESTYYIRQNWTVYDVMKEELRSFFEKEKGDNQQLNAAITRTHKIIDSKKFDWSCTDDKDTFPLVRYYTNPSGYKYIFGFVNRDIFRNDISIEDIKKIRAAVFLVELINIELFNMCIVKGGKANWTGVVYRGMGVAQGIVDVHLNLLKKPLPQRYISIPLYLQSTSKNVNVALEFMQCEMMKKSKETPKVMFMLRTDVIEMIPDLLRRYRERFPTSTVSTICAVPIDDNSDMSYEEEVILRGPFFQLLRSSKEKTTKGKEYTVIDTMILNTNRDHISTALLGEQDTPARIFFGTAVQITRYEFAAKFCADHNMIEDQRGYEILAREAQTKLDSLE